MMKVASAVALAIALALLAAQGYSATPVIGVLSSTDQADDAPWKALRQGLAELGYVEGQNIRIEYLQA